MSSSNFKIECVSSSKLPPCDNITKNPISEGHICNVVTVEAAVAKGTVLKAGTVSRQVIPTPGAADLAVLGVASETASAGSQTCMAVGGEFQVLVTGAVTMGDFLASSATAGIAESTGVAGFPGDFAVAMNTDAAVGTKLVWARYKKAEVF